ncbi:hypothetical protein [Phytohabitans kaempferiae]|uniref:Lipoprotein LpqB beta-propeller domain-containing protein n=1 Tax=Phytohabitans kaempferiae TaxID=1620943 RepID=A0ABV6MHN7_9ACTN
MVASVVAALLLGGGAAPVRQPWDRPAVLDGVPRWRRDGTVRLIDRVAGLVVLEELTAPVADQTAGLPRASYRLVELATGREVWPWAVRPVVETLVAVAVAGDDSGLTGLLQRDRAGRTLLHDVATGQSRPLVDPPRVTDAYRSGDDLLLLADHGTGAELVRYDWVTLRPRWLVAEPVGVLLGRCGPWLCIVGGDSTAAVDPATGQVRWRPPGAAAVPGHPLVLHEYSATARLSYGWAVSNVETVRKWKPLACRPSIIVGRSFSARRRSPKHY